LFINEEFGELQKKSCHSIQKYAREDRPTSDTDATSGTDGSASDADGSSSSAASNSWKAVRFQVLKNVDARYPSSSERSFYSNQGTQTAKRSNRLQLP
jgi:hypothetical protein